MFAPREGQSGFLWTRSGGNLGQTVARSSPCGPSNKPIRSMQNQTPFPPDGMSLLQMDQPTDIGALFHRLNNQLGVILANAELLESRLSDEAGQARAVQIVTSAVEAISAVRHIREHCRD